MQDSSAAASTTKNGVCEVDCTHDALPDACGNDLRQEKLLHRQHRGETETRNWFKRALDRDKNLIISCLVLVLCMNIETGKYVLYPFTIFSTWIHEMCHGMAAILSGGFIAKLEIFSNGSGLAYTGGKHSAFVASAGYPGTAVTGCLLLLFRRTTLGPTVGTIGLGLALLTSCALYVRNTFGLVVLPIMGVFLLLAGWKLPAVWLDNLYAFLAATCCLNAIENIKDLFSASQGYAGGVLMDSDASAVASYWGGDYRTWATTWLVMAAVLTVVGIVGARDARALPWNNNANSSSGTTTNDAASTHMGTVNNDVYTNNASSVNHNDLVIPEATVVAFPTETQPPPPTNPAWWSKKPKPAQTQTAATTAESSWVTMTPAEPLYTAYPV